jgi:ATP-grasp domain
MTWDLCDFRLVTASAYPGMMAPLTHHESCVCVLSGDADHGPPRMIPALSLEGLDGIRRRWRFGDVARLADFVPKVLADSKGDDRPILLVPPRVSPAWEAAAATWPVTVRLVGRPPAEGNQIAEDKIYVRGELSRLGVPVPAARVLTPSEMDFATLVSDLDTPFVMQAPNGAGGQGTYLVRDEAALAHALRRHPHVERWLVSGYAGDTTINVAGVVHRDGVRILPASVQSSGIAELGVGFGSYCGSDFAAAARLPHEVRAEADRHTMQIGQWLRGRGHLGLFGADIAVAGRRIAFLEVNPRIQGSSWLLSKLQLGTGGPSCLELHVQALLGRPFDSVPAAIAAIAPGSHLLWRWDGPAGIVCAAPAPGPYPLPGGGDETVTVTGLPGIGTYLMPGAIVARLETSASLAAPNGRGLPPATCELLATLRGGFEIVAAPASDGL